MKIPLLEVCHLSHSYGRRRILDDLDFLLYPNEIVSLLGASGSGKTTLFKLLSGILPIQKGMVTPHISSPNPYQGQIAYLTQEDLLLPWRTVLANLTLTAELGKMPFSKNEREHHALLLLQEMGLEKHAYQFPHELSGGMRQRVNLARALCLKRPILLLDEPFNGLDIHLKEALFEYLLKIKSDKKLTIFFITHDFRDALTLSDRILFLKNGQLTKSWTIHEAIKQDPLPLLKELRQAFIP